MPRPIWGLVLERSRALPFYESRIEWTKNGQDNQSQVLCCGTGQGQEKSSCTASQRDVVVLGEAPAVLDTDPKYQGELIQQLMESREELASASLASEILVLDLAPNPKEEHKQYTGAAQQPKFNNK